MRSPGGSGSASKVCPERFDTKCWNSSVRCILCQLSTDNDSQVELWIRWKEHSQSCGLQIGLVALPRDSKKMDLKLGFPTVNIFVSRIEPGVRRRTVGRTPLHRIDVDPRKVLLLRTPLPQVSATHEQHVNGGEASALFESRPKIPPGNPLPTTPRQTHIREEFRDKHRPSASRHKTVPAS